MHDTRAVIRLTCPHCRADARRTAPDFRKWPHSFLCGVCGETVSLTSAELARVFADLECRGFRERFVSLSA